MRFRDLLGGKGGKGGPAASADIEAAIGAAEQAAADASRRLDELSLARGVALVDDDDPTLDRVEAETTQARRDLDRAELAIEELRRRLAEAGAAERLAELDRTHAAGEAAQQRALRLIGEYGRLAGAMVPLLLELAARDREVAAANAALEDGHDPRRVEDPDRLARPQRGMPAGRWPLYRAVRLPDPADPAVTLYPPDTLREGTAAMVAAYEAGRRG